MIDKTDTVAIDATEEPKPTPNVLHDVVVVPAGHVWTSGRKLERPIKIVLTYGVRWHPEWTGPKWSATASQFFSGGDSIGYKANTLIEEFSDVLPEAVRDVLRLDGMPASGGQADRLARLGIAIPSEPEAYADFIPYNPTKKKG